MFFINSAKLKCDLYDMTNMSNSIVKQKLKIVPDVEECIEDENSADKEKFIVVEIRESILLELLSALINSD